MQAGGFLHNQEPVWNSMFRAHNLQLFIFLRQSLLLVFEMIPGFAIDEKVRAYIRKNGQDFRLSTSSEGPVLMPLGDTSPKPSDLKILVGSNVLYVSKLQAKYIKKIDWSMVERYLGSAGEPGA